MKKKVEKIKEKISSIKLSLFKGIYKENLGKFKSNFKGNGLQFKDHRSYVYGDDIRGINWSLLAKNGSPYVKEHEEERNVNLTVILDVSSSMLYGLNKVSKLDVCIELVCLLYLVAQETNDWVSVFFVGGKAESLGKGRGEEGFFKFLMKLKDLGLLNNNGEVNISYSYSLSNIEIKKQESYLETKKGNKNVKFFSDFHLWTNKDFSYYIFSSYWRLFRIASPIDNGINNSVSLLFKPNFGLNGKKLAQINDSLKNKTNKYLKTLNINEDYLNYFLREIF